MKRIFIAALSAVTIVLLPAFTESTQTNSIPRVTLQTKSGLKSFSPGQPLSYIISVEDKEDGSSKYEEIAGTEVYLEIRFLPDSGLAKKFLDQRVAEAPVLQAMKKGNCFNCHGINRKLAGPPFAEVLAKHAAKPGLTDYLAGKIIQGSKGVWGDSQVMPSHPELTKEQAVEIAAWIRKKGTDPAYEIQTGLAGKFSTVAPAAAGKTSAYLLIASYLDHGINGTQNLEAKQVLMLANK